MSENSHDAGERAPLPIRIVLRRVGTHLGRFLLYQDGQGRRYEEQPAEPSGLHECWETCDRCGREMLAGEMLYFWADDFGDHRTLCTRCVEVTA
jgi:hypothetical protein